MSMPFSFTGALTLADADEASDVTDRISKALHSEGGRNISFSNHIITFDGLTNYRSLSPLTNIVHGEIKVDGSSPTRVYYSVTTEKSALLVPLSVALAATAATFVGFKKFGPFAIFGAVVFLFAFALSFSIRRRFRRWLRATLQAP